MAALDVYRALWQRRYLVVVLTAVVTAVAWFTSSSETKMYEATALVRIQQKIADPSQAYGALAVGQRLAETYAKIVTTQTITHDVFLALHRRVPEGEIHISASPVQDLDLLDISATSADPARAAEVANAAPGVLRRFIARTGTINDQIITINQADVPATPISPHPNRVALLALLVGLVLNGGLALLFEFFADRLPDVEELETSIGKPVLATIPTLSFTASIADRLEPRVGTAMRVASAADAIGATRTTQPGRGVG